ncbi:MAG TPA: SDR family NAD(P)-dependent oxidoreductase [Mycobacteriales bacterium]|nr:SDR family NAD(P)-dependent oxidoreductase [Mycobacteriales bacterium]
MASEVPASAWRGRYPDLAGRVAVVAGDDEPVIEIAAALAATGMSLAVVSAARATVDHAIAAVETYGVAVIGVAADPAESATWSRVVPHSEQRLGPLDVLVAIGRPHARDAALAAITPDMAARRRGVVIEVGEARPAGTPSGDGVRRRLVTTAHGAAASDLAAAVALCASDVLMAPSAVIRLGES